MSNKNARRIIQSFLVHDGLQEIVGEEDRRFHYVLFLAMLGGLYVAVDLIVRSRLHEVQRAFLLILLGVVALVLMAQVRPWHRRIVIDRNGPVCRVEWRFLYLFPVSWRSYHLEDRVLDVGTVAYEEAIATGKSGDTPWGCLLILIPFPFNLLAGAFSKSAEEGRVITVKRQVAVLMLRSRSDMNGKPIARLSGLKVADPLLWAAGALLPDHVVMPPRDDPPPE